jgi:hypothetical protein
VKLFVEKAQIELTPNDNKAAQLYVDFLQHRQNEIEELIFEGQYDLLPEVFHNYQSEVSLALDSLKHLADSDPSGAQKLMVALDNTLSSQLVSWAVLKDVIPAEYRVLFDQMMQFTMDSSAEVETLLEDDT